MSTRRLNLRRQQSLGGDDGAVKWKAKGKETYIQEYFFVLLYFLNYFNNNNNNLALLLTLGIFTTEGKI